MAGLRFPEGNRWRDGKLWYVDMHTGEVFVLDPEQGTPQLLATCDGQSSGLGWLADGTPIVSSMNDMTIRAIEADGSLRVFCDLSSVGDSMTNDLMVDEATGRIYVGAFGFDLYGGAPPKLGPLYVVEPDGEPRVAADGFDFPNGAVIIPGTRTMVLAETWGYKLTALDIDDDGGLSHRRTWADLPQGITPDGICADVEGGIWVSALETGDFLRVLEGGEVTDRFQLPGRNAIDCILGGSDGRTLFVSSADSYTPAITENTRRGRIQSLRVTVAGRI